MIIPPHTINSIKLYIAKVEQLGRQASSKLFRNMESMTPMDTAKVLVEGGGLGEDLMVYVHLIAVEYRVTQMRRQSKFNTLNMNTLLAHHCF
jgi:hypothetical protein